jgi:hypothetical protein
MNKTEEAYSKMLTIDPTVEAWWFEPFGLRLADGTFYHPDFMVQRKNGMVEVHEVKGFWRDDARVKIKVAAERFPFAFFVATQKKGEFYVERV